jgi:thiosulfate reductase cytochrome b subunit
MAGDVEGHYARHQPHGLWIASIALLIMLWQIGIGLMLRDPLQSNRRKLRRTHFWTMTSVAGFIVVHVSLNRP